MPTTPPQSFLYVTPFVQRNDGVLASPELSSGGGGYTAAFVEGVISASAGTGGRVVLNVDTVSGQAIGLFVYSKGSGYSNPSVSFPTPGSGTSATGRVYANQKQAILGYPGAENRLLTLAKTQGIDSLILYDLNFMDWPTNGTGTVSAPGKTMLKNFIDKAKRRYGISHVSAARGFGSTAQAYTKSKEIFDYNYWCQTNGFYSGLIDSITTEVEWWQASPEIGFTGVVAGLSAAYRLYSPTGGTGGQTLSSSVGINVYLGKGPGYTGSQPGVLQPYVDRWFVSTYKSTANAQVTGTLYGDTRGATGSLYRLHDIARGASALGLTASVYPIYSVESKYHPYNGNGGFNGVTYTSVDPDSSEDFMGLYYAGNSASTGPVPPRTLAGAGLTIDDSWEAWYGNSAGAYSANQTWLTETDPTISGRILPGGVSLFHSALLSSAIALPTTNVNGSIYNRDLTGGATLSTLGVVGLYTLNPDAPEVIEYETASITATGSYSFELSVDTTAQPLTPFLLYASAAGTALGTWYGNGDGVSIAEAQYLYPYQSSPTGTDLSGIDIYRVNSGWTGIEPDTATTQAWNVDIVREALREGPTALRDYLTASGIDTWLDVDSYGSDLEYGWAGSEVPGFGTVNVRTAGGPILSALSDYWLVNGSVTGGGSGPAGTVDDFADSLYSFQGAWASSLGGIITGLYMEPDLITNPPALPTDLPLVDPEAAYTPTLSQGGPPLSPLDGGVGWLPSITPPALLADGTTAGRGNLQPVPPYRGWTAGTSKWNL